MEDVGQRWGKKGVEEGNTLSRFKQLSGEERTDCSTWRPDQWHQGHRVTATSHSSLRSSPILSPFPSPSFLLSSPPQLLHTLKQHMVVHWVLSQSSQGSTLLDLMQQIKLWHLLVLLTKTAQSVALLGTLFSLDHQLLKLLLVCSELQYRASIPKVQFVSFHSGAFSKSAQEWAPFTHDEHVASIASFLPHLGHESFIPKAPLISPKPICAQSRPCHFGGQLGMWTMRIRSSVRNRHVTWKRTQISVHKWWGCVSHLKRMTLCE